MVQMQKPRLGSRVQSPGLAITDDHKLKAREMYSLTVLEPRRQKSGCRQSRAPSEGPEKESFQLPVAAGSPWCASVVTCMSPTSASVLTWRPPAVGLRLCVQMSISHEDIRHWIRLSLPQYDPILSW